MIGTKTRRRNKPFPSTRNHHAVSSALFFEDNRVDRQRFPLVPSPSASIYTTPSVLLLPCSLSMLTPRYPLCVCASALHRAVFDLSNRFASRSPIALANWLKLVVSAVSISVADLCSTHCPLCSQQPHNILDLASGSKGAGSTR